MRWTSRFLMLLIIAFACSCGSGKKVASKKRDSPKEQRSRKNTGVVLKDSRSTRTGGDEKTAPRSYADKISDYIALYAPIAQEEMRLYKIPASITLAQGILESGAGEGELTLKANNHFGIKCHGWKGDSVYHDDDLSQECFRKYKDPKYSFRDHSLFLTERLRYAALFELDMYDYKGWAKGLKAAGYATDRKYPDKLISLIERYQLYLYDGGPARDNGVAYQETSPQGGRQYVVKQGDTLYSIAKKYNLTVDQLKRNNNLRDNNIGIGQVLNINP